MATPLAALRPILSLLPEVKTPTVPPSFSERILWTGAALFIFFAMYNVLALGVNPSIADTATFLQVVTASRLGSLITVGIGPIVLASIFLQLFVGAKILPVDMSNPDEKMLFQGTQKLLAILLCFFEAAIFVQLSGLPTLPIFGDFTHIAVILQIAAGSLILLYLDEIVSKHGLGSGISLFIAAAVSLSIIAGSISLLFEDNGLTSVLADGGAQVIAKALEVLLPIFVTLAVFLVIVYIEGIKIVIPLSFERARGIATGFPIKFMYVSNIPVILAFALLANFQFLALGLADANLCMGGTLNAAIVDKAAACQGGIDLINVIGRSVKTGSSQAQFVDGFLYLIQPVHHQIGKNYGTQFLEYFTSASPIFGIPEWVHIGVYIVFLMALCVVFGQFWVETTGMDSESVAKQLDDAGLQIPGYRRDPRIVKSLLDKYIPPIVLMGSAFVGLLAGLADLTGALGTGTGILLTVGIIYKLYQDAEKYNPMGQSALLQRFMGK